MVDAFTTTDVVLAVIGTLLGLIPVTVWIIGRSLPSYKLRILEDTLQETESLLRTCVEEGRFVESQVAVQLGGHLRGLRERTNDLRVVTSGAKTYVDDIRNMIKGFSRQSDDLCEEVKEVRAKISSSSSGRNANTSNTQGHTSSGLEVFDATDTTRGPRIPAPQCLCLLTVARGVSAATGSSSPPYASCEPGEQTAAFLTPDIPRPVDPSILARLLSLIFFTSLPVPPPDSPVNPFSQIDGGAFDTQMRPLLRNSSWQSGSSEQTTMSQSARRKKRRNVIARARARARLSRRSYL